MSKQDLKHILISILIGAAVAFFSSLFQALADFINEHGQNFLSGGVTSFIYLARKFHDTRLFS